MSRLKAIWPLLILLLVPLLPLHRAVFGGEAIGPWDQIQPMALGEPQRFGRPWDVLQADAALQFMPWRHLVFESYRSGKAPLWNPYELCGTPLLANSQSAGFYPPHVVLGVLRVPDTAAVTLLAWLHLFVVGWGIYALVRRMGGDEYGGLFSGVSVQLSSFMLGWLGLASVPTTVAWLPWVLLGVLRFFPTERLALAKLSFAVAMTLLGGHLQFSAYALLGALVVWAVMIVADRKVQLVPLFAIGLGVLLSAPQLLPVLNYGKSSHRSNVATSDGYYAYTKSAIQPFEFASVAIPSILGNPRAWSLQGSPLSSYWPQFVKLGANFAESSVAVGPLVLLLLFFAPWREPTTRALGAVSLVGLLLCTGSFLCRLFYFGIPGWSATGSPGRAAVLMVLPLCCVAGLGLRQITLLPPRRWFLLLLPVGLCLPPYTLLTISHFSSPVGLDDKVISNLVVNAMTDSVIGLAAALLTGVLLLFLLTSKRHVHGQLSACALALIVGMSVGVGSLVPTGQMISRPGDLATVSSPSNRVAWVNQSWSLFEAPKSMMPANLSSLFGVREVGGYDSLTHKDSAALLRDINGADPSPPENGNMMWVKPTFNAEKLVAAGASLALGKSVPAILMGERITFAGQYTIVEDDNNQVQLKTSGKGLLTVRDRNITGWTVNIDGVRSEVVAGTWLTAELPSGDHLVTFEYVPPGLGLGYLLCSFALSLVVTVTLRDFSARSSRTILTE